MDNRQIAVFIRQFKRLCGKLGDALAEGDTVGAKIELSWLFDTIRHYEITDLIGQIKTIAGNLEVALESEDVTEASIEAKDFAIALEIYESNHPNQTV